MQLIDKVISRLPYQWWTHS